MTAGVRRQINIVDHIAQRGYDHINKLEKRRKLFEQNKNRICSLESCDTKLSMYNDTDFCAIHQRGNLPLPKDL